LGNTAVAVLHYDCHSEIKRISPQMARAMTDMPGTDEQDFGFGRIVAWDHSSAHQVCVIHGNTGWRVLSDNKLPPDVEQALADALKRRGWSVRAPMSR